MATEVWRIAADTPDYGADDLSGKGAEKTGGRWNRKGAALLYCSSTISLACLETLVHLAGSDPLPLNRYLVRIPIPPTAWKKRTVFGPKTNMGWDAEPPGLVSMDWGTVWVKSSTSLIAEVPSAIVPEESNVLINPMHADAGRLRAEKLRRWTYDLRLANSLRSSSGGRVAGRSPGSKQRRPH
jgi:RES domain-containing protein